MRPITSRDEALYRSGSTRTLLQVLIRDSGGVLRDWTDLDGKCWVKSVTWGEDIGSPFISGELLLFWTEDQWNSSPFTTGSLYDGYLDVWREIQIRTKSVPQGVDPATIAWDYMVEGIIDNYDLSQNPASIPFRILRGAHLMDAWIRTNTRYGNNAGTDDIEDVINDIFTDWASLATFFDYPSPTGFQVKDYVQQKMSIWTAFQNIVQQIGWDMRVVYNVANDDFRVKIYEPDRSVAVSVHTFLKSQYFEVTQFQNGVENVRNHIRVYYGDFANKDDLGNDLRANVEVQNPASIAKHGRRFMELGLGAASLVQDIGGANTLALAALEDLRDPTIEFGITLTNYFKHVEINDYYGFEADGKLFDADQDFGIVGYKHTFDEDGATTQLIVRGKPTLSPNSWLIRSSGLGGAVVTDDAPTPAPNSNAVAALLGGTITLDYLNQIGDYDQFLYYRNATSGFTPDASNLVKIGRSTRITFHDGSPGVEQFVKVRVRDLGGNLSPPSAEVSYTPATIPRNFVELDQPSESRTLSADVTVGAGALNQIDFDTQDWLTGHSTSFWVAANDEFDVPFDGAYLIELHLFADAIDSESLSWRPLIYLNGALKRSGPTVGVGATSFINTQIFLSAGDLIDARAEEVGGINDLVLDFNECFFTVTRVA